MYNSADCSKLFTSMVKINVSFPSFISSVKSNVYFADKEAEREAIKLLNRDKFADFKASESFQDLIHLVCKGTYVVDDLTIADTKRMRRASNGKNELKKRGTICVSPTRAEKEKRDRQKKEEKGQEVEREKKEVPPVAKVVAEKKGQGGMAPMNNSSNVSREKLEKDIESKKNISSYSAVGYIGEWKGSNSILHSSDRKGERKSIKMTGPEIKMDGKRFSHDKTKGERRRSSTAMSSTGASNRTPASFKNSSKRLTMTQSKHGIDLFDI
mmetsp:Transcript_6155/g.9404  ORF Transcript_6155/g.9404 Transcript_6155/m.9404 type:complete len:269 (+) Transcript_6155:2174-2980(+)